MRGLITLLGAGAGAASLSQFPEFSQQYLQRLAGQVDALTVIVADFDHSAQKNGLTRDEALAQMTGTSFLDDRQRDLRRTFLRQAVLADNLAELRAATPLERISMPQRLADPETLAATWQDFRPAVPVTVDGAITAGIGGVAGWGVVGVVLSLLLAPFRRRRTA